jgi:hypothetical protein
VPHKIDLKKALSWTLVGMAMSLVVGFYHWTVKTGGGFDRPHDEDYYNFMVEGWRQGHLYMNKVPSAAMLALKDPYDPGQNRDVRLADASYFKGHYYLYFGAAPAFILMWPFDVLTGGEMGTTTAIFIFCVTGYLASCGLWLAIRARYFPLSSVGVGGLGVLLLGLGTHVLALERRPLVWELPISMGFAFSMLALLGIYAALHGKRPALSFALSGLCLGLAVAARPTCLLGAVMFAPALWQMREQATQRTQWIRCGVAAACGMGVCLIAVLAHNFARFGDALEFGQNFQLSGVYESRMRHFSLGYIPHNLYLYYFHPGTWSLKFPFVSTAIVTGGPVGYIGEWSEPITGLAVTFPFLWFALALPMALRPPGGDGRLRAILRSIVAFFLAMSLAILAYFVATERYMADCVPALGLIALCGWLGVEARALRSGYTWIAMSFWVTASIVTLVAGVFVSFDYHSGLLHTIYPQSWDALKSFFHRFGL